MSGSQKIMVVDWGSRPTRARSSPAERASWRFAKVYEDPLELLRGTDNVPVGGYVIALAREHVFGPVGSVRPSDDLEEELCQLKTPAMA